MLPFVRDYYSDTLDVWSLIIIRLDDQPSFTDQHRADVVRSVLETQWQERLVQKRDFGDDSRFRLMLGDWNPVGSAMFVLCLMRTISDPNPTDCFSGTPEHPPFSLWRYGPAMDWPARKEATFQCLQRMLGTGYNLEFDDGNGDLEPMFDAGNLNVTWTNDIAWVSLSDVLTQLVSLSEE